LKTPEGGFYSAEDADSEGEEGKFYLWTEDEIRGLLDREEAEILVLAFGVELTEDLLRHYWDEEGGGFYFTADDGEMLLARQKEVYDGALPSGNSVAMWNLLRLARMTANPELEAKAARLGRAFSRYVQRSPSSHTQLLVALDFVIGPSCEVVIAGNSGAEDTRAMLQALRREFLPRTAILLRPSEREWPPIVRIAPSLKDPSSIHGKAAAYLCSGGACQPPTTEIGELLKLLEA